MESKKFDLEQRLLNYSVSIVRITDCLYRSRAGNHVAGQLLRSGTSPLANHGEAQAAESSSDFIHKMKLCLKELRESLRWLMLIQRAPLTKQSSDVDTALRETDELIRFFVTSIRTAEKQK